MLADTLLQTVYWFLVKHTTSQRGGRHTCQVRLMAMLAVCFILHLAMFRRTNILLKGLQELENDGGKPPVYANIANLRRSHYNIHPELL